MLPGCTGSGALRYSTLSTNAIMQEFMKHLPSKGLLMEQMEGPHGAAGKGLCLNQHVGFMNILYLPKSVRLCSEMCVLSHISITHV